MKFFGWMNWKNEDEIRSRLLDDTKVELNITVNMRPADFATLIEQYGRDGFYITFEKIKAEEE